MREARIADEKRLEAENQRIKEWEIKFDEEQRKKEEELIRRFEEKENIENQIGKNNSSNDDTH